MIGYNRRGESGAIVGTLVSGVLLAAFPLPSIEFTILRAFIGFLLVTVVPGYVLLSAFGVRRLSPARFTFYALGVSLIYTLAVVLTVNFALPLVGIVTPISAAILASSLAVPLLAIWFGFGARSPRSLTAVRRIPTESGPFVLFVTSLPIYAVFGTHLANVTGYTLLIVPLLLLLAIVPLLCIRWELPAWIRPYIIWLVSLTILLHMTLVSGHLWGWDIHYQYHVASIIYDAQYWDPNLAMSSNSLISITLLAAVYSTITGMEIVWVYKIVYPILASVVPVGAYLLFDRVFSDRILVTLAPFALVFYYGFFKDMPDKQLIALLFFVMFLAVLLDDQLSKRASITTGALFGVGVVVSHYGVSLLLIAFIGFTSAVVFVLRRYDLVDVEELTIARPELVLFIGGFWFAWFALTAAGVNLESIVRVGYTSVLEFASGSTERSGAYYATRESQSLAWLVYQLLYMGLVGFLGIGIAKSTHSMLLGRAKGRPEFIVFSVAVLSFLCGSVLVTFGMGFDRTLQIALVVLAPYGVIGLQTSVSGLTRVMSIEISDRSASSGKLFAAFLLVLFLFSSGIGFAAIDGEQPAYNVALDREAGWPVYAQSEVDATRWVETHRGNEPVVMFNRWEAVKSRDGLLLSEVLFDDQMDGAWEDQESLDNPSYIYLSEKPMTETGSETEYIDPRETAFYEQNIAGSDKIYHSGDAEIYYAR